MDGGVSTSSLLSALDVARSLKPPDKKLRTNGEFEGAKFWQEHAEVLKKARKEYGTIRFFNETFDEERYLSSELRNAIKEIKSSKTERKLHDLFRESIPGVFVSEVLFSESLLCDLVEELDYQKLSGIPERRPNGMNRYGSILSDEESSLLAPVMEKFVHRVVHPIASALFPEYASSNSMSQHYAFTVRYAEDEDQELAMHRDASVVTMNLCLGKRFEDGVLSFANWEDPIRDSPLFASSSSSSSSFSSSSSSQKTENANNTLLLHTIEMTPGMSLWHRVRYHRIIAQTTQHIQTHTQTNMLFKNRGNTNTKHNQLNREENGSTSLSGFLHRTVMYVSCHFLRASNLVWPIDGSCSTSNIYYILIHTSHGFFYHTLYTHTTYIQHILIYTTVCVSLLSYAYNELARLSYEIEIGRFWRLMSVMAAALTM